MGTDQTIIRTPDQRLRVFVSSTLQELSEERAAAQRAITSLRLNPVLFELGARPHPPRDLYRAYLDQSHIFIGIYWERYGWIAPDETVSGLEDEYRLAGSKPKLIYVKSPALDREPRLKELLDRIRADDQASYKYFSSPVELEELITNDLVVLLSERFEIAGMAGKLSEETSQKRDNLPARLTSFVGRKKELAEIIAVLRSEDLRLVTLTGPGGVGKSRLALQAAEGVLDEFEHGVYFVPLASIRDPSLVPGEIANILGIRETRGQELTDSLKSYFDAKKILLLLDGFEQVIQAASLVSELLADADKLHVLVTSRAPLRLRGEREVPVSPLTLPDLHQPSSVEDLSHSEAIELFVQRAGEVKPDFALTNENAKAVASICQRLDGLPLAIELAAARIKILSPQALRARLDNRLNLLTEGPRDLPARQQTLRNTIDWSYDLLDDSQKVLFRRLGVFAGGCTLEAAEVVCNPAGDPHIDLLQPVASLLDESLLRRQEGRGGEPRFSMLGTIRDYALERLDQSGEAAGIWQRHADYYLALAERVDPKLRSGERDAGLKQLEIEQDNLREALSWSQKAEQGEKSLHLAGALAWFWYFRGQWSEGRGWLERALARAGDDSPPGEHGKALLGAGIMAASQGDSQAALQRLKESTDEFRRAGDKVGLAHSLAFLGMVKTWHSDPKEARAILEESIAISQESGERWGLALARGYLGDALTVLGQAEAAQNQGEQSVEIFRELGDQWGLVVALDNLGSMALQRGDEAGAYSWLEESVAISRQIGDKSFIGFPLVHLADIVRKRGDFDRATSLYEEALSFFREVGSKWGMAASFQNLGQIAKEKGDYQQAASLFKESLPFYLEIGLAPGVAGCLAGLAGIAAAEGHLERAAKLAGAAQALQQSHPVVPGATYFIDFESELITLHNQLGQQSFSVAWEQGREMTLEQAVRYGLEA